MKNKLFILSSLCLLLLLNGCAVKPEATVSSYFDELKTTI
jgi:PBP1b-binding outer membrane lipoprotein LpoB